MGDKLKQLFTGLLFSTLAALTLGCADPPAEVATLEHVAEQPHAMSGEQVTAEGRVTRVFGDCAFELEDGDPLTPDRLLTLCEPAGPHASPPEAPADVAEGDWLRITGVAGEMTRENYEFKTTLTMPEDVFGKKTTRAVIFVEKAEKVLPPSEREQGARRPEGANVEPTS